MADEDGPLSSFFRSYGDEDRLSSFDGMFVVLATVLAGVYAIRSFTQAHSGVETRFVALVFVLGSTGFLALFLGWSTRRSEEPFARGPFLYLGLPAHAVALFGMAFLRPPPDQMLLLALAGAGGLFLLVPFRRANPQVRGVEFYIAGALMLTLLPVLTSAGAVTGIATLAIIVIAAPLTAAGLHLLLDARIPHPTLVTHLLATTAVIYAWAGSLRILLGTPEELSAIARNGLTGTDLALAYLAPVLGAASVGSILLTKIIERDADRLLAEGNRQYAQGKYEGSLQSYTQALRIQPGSKVIRTCMADALARNGNLDRALGEYDRVLKVDPEYTPAINGKGSALRNQGKTDRAILYHQKALLVTPTSPTAWTSKGNAFYARGDPDMALFCYRSALEIDSAHAGAWFNYAAVLLNLGRKEESTYAFRRLKETLDAQSEQKLRRPAISRAPGTTALVKALRFPLEYLIENTEERLYTFVVHNAGADVPSAASALGVEAKLIVRVMGRLRRAGMIETKREGRVIRLFPRDVKAIEIEVAEMSGENVLVSKRHYLTEAQKTVIELLRVQPRQTLHDIAEHAKLPESVAAYHLKVLSETGYIAGRTTGKKGAYVFEIR